MQLYENVFIYYEHRVPKSEDKHRDPIPKMNVE